MTARVLSSARSEYRNQVGEILSSDKEGKHYLLRFGSWQGWFRWDELEVPYQDTREAE